MIQFPPGWFRSFAEDTVPKGVKDRTRDFISNRLTGQLRTYQEIRSWSEVDSWSFDTEHTFTYTEPRFYNTIPKEIRDILGNHHIHQPFVLEVPNITLFGRQGIKRMSDGKFLVYDLFRPSSNATRSRLAKDIVDGLSMGVWPFWPNRHRSKADQLDLAVPLLNRWATNYAHWNEECLTQIQGVSHYEAKTGERPTIILPADSPSFIYESLEQLGYGDTDVYEIGSKPIHVDRMVLPSIRLFDSKTSDDQLRDPYALRWLRRQIIEATENQRAGPVDFSSRILVSRKDADSRRITNWSSVEKMLADQGFQSVVLSDLDFLTQVQIFNQANIVVATHGAGLSNLMYGNDTKVVELFGSHFVSTYYQISQAIGHRYVCLQCQPVGADIRVDITELEEALKKLTGPKTKTNYDCDY